MSDGLPDWMEDAPDLPDWMEDDAPKQPPAKMSSGRAGVLGAARGATLDFVDEIGGALGQALIGGGVKLGPAAQPRPEDTSAMRATKLQVLGEEAARPSTYRLTRDLIRDESKQAEQEQGGAHLIGQLLGGAALIPLAPTGGPATLANAMKTGAVLGAGSGLGASEADLLRGDVGRTLGDAALGGVFGAAAGAGGHGAGKLLGKTASTLSNRAGSKIANIESAVVEAAKKEAAAETASARSAAGTAAQDAYRQLEHLRELGRLGQLAPEEAQIADELAAELAEKAQAKLAPAVARKAEKAGALRLAMESEAKRAEELAAQKLSGSELKQQTMARLTRYGLPALGGAALAAATGERDPMRLLGGAGLGALGGAGMRPMMHSLLRMAKQPVVQRPLWKALQRTTGLANLAGETVESLAGPLGRAFGAEADDMLIPALAGEPDEMDRQRRLAAILRRR